MNRLVLTSLCAALVLSGFLTTVLSGQEETNDLEKRVAALEVAVRDARLLADQQNGVIRDQEKRLAAFDLWMQGLPGGLVQFRAAVDAADKEGFTFAAPNPRSKELLLQALRGLAKSLDVPTPKR